MGKTEESFESVPIQTERSIVNQEAYTMTETKNSKKLTDDQIQAILDSDHIRRHLIKHGLINYHGNIIPKEEYKRRPRREYSSKKYPVNTRRPLITVSPKRHTEKITNPKRQARDDHSNERRLKSAPTSQSKQIIPEGDRCHITMMYLGSETVIDYDREWFGPEGDEIVIMQQHCGGENLVVYKGSVKPDNKFIFESRRHADYPFALALYVNGLIDNRLSICCEARCNNYMRIGGKRGTFAIINVDKGRPCRRCRYEQRMKKLTESDPPKPAKKVDHRYRQNPKTTPKICPYHTKHSKSTKTDLKPITNQSRTTDQYVPDFEDSDEKHDNDRTEAPRSNTSERKPNNQRPPAIGDSDEIHTISDESDDDFNARSRANRRRSTDD